MKRLALAVAVLSAACSSAGSGGRVQIVTAFYPLEFVATTVGKGYVHVTNLTPPGAEPHDLELKPGDVRALRSADLVLYFADGFQPSVQDAIGSLPDSSNARDLLKGLQLRRTPGDELDVDPHVWLSPVLMGEIVNGVTVAIANKVDASVNDVVGANGTALLRKLGELDAEYSSTLKRCARHEIFTSHAAFGYLAARYGLRQIAIEGSSPEAEPSSQRLQEVARTARAAGATTIFFEPLVSPRIAQTVARIAGMRTAELDPIEGIERGSNDDYFTVMRRNLAALKEALACA